jgi:hypothetical protein
MTSQSIPYQLGSSNDGGLGARAALVVAFAVLLFVGSSSPAAAQAPMPRFKPQPQRIVPLDAVLLETLRIEGRVQGWTMRKLCIDGQAYWVGFSETNPTGISPSFKDGKAEQCSPPAK